MKKVENLRATISTFPFPFTFLIAPCPVQREGFESSFSFFSLGYVQGLITILPIDIDK
jgi:hypothetical protein